MAMSPYSGFLPHGGEVSAARAQFPGAPEPFVDLSTGINPIPYPVSQFSADLFARLPEPAAVAALRAAGPPAVPAQSYPEHARAVAVTGHDVKTVRGIDACGDATLVIVANPNNPDG